MTSRRDIEGLPTPAPDRDTQPFWDGTAAHTLLVQHCADCGQWIWQPKPLCPGCHAESPAWEQVDGGGKVTSWIVPHPPVLPSLADLVPFCVLLVELSEGIRMTGLYVDADDQIVRAEPSALEGLEVGAPVELRWREQLGWTIPSWTLSLR
jgi:uncharacterized protein